MKKNIKILIITFIVVLSCHLSFAQEFMPEYIRSVQVINTQSAYTLERGSFLISNLAYEGGSTELKTVIGLHDNIYFGISLDMQGLIGRDKVKFNIPGVIAKIKLTDGWQRFPISMSLGYDSFYAGQPAHVNNETNILNRVIYGPYFVITKPIYLFHDEQHLHFGVRMPVQPYFVPQNTSYFLALDIPLGEYFIVKGEMERVYWNFSRPKDWLWSVGFRYTYMYHLGIEFDLTFQIGEKPNRMLRIEYCNVF